MTEDFMRAGYVNKQIKAEIGGLLKTHGFKPIKDMGFIRKTQSGFHCVSNGLTNWAPEYKISLDVHIRLDAVAAIVNRFTGVSVEHEPYSFTMTIDRTLISDDGMDRITVFTPDELAQALATFKSLLIEKVMPLFGRCADVKSVWVLLSEYPTLNRLISPYAQLANLTLARLNASPQFDAMVQQYRDELGQLNPKNKERFEQLVAYLYAKE